MEDVTESVENESSGSGSKSSKESSKESSKSSSSSVKEDPVYDSNQQMIDDFISNLPADADEYLLPSVSGPVDLGIIEKQGRTPTVLRFKRGEITHLLNFPQSVRALYIDRNELEELPQEGVRNLKILSCNNNHISRVDTENFSNLEELYLNHNDIVELYDLPSTLKVLEIDDNYELQFLDLGSAPNLKRIMCVHVSNLRKISNFCQMKNKGLALDTDMHVEIEYVDECTKVTKTTANRERTAAANMVSIDEYYELKNKYHMMRKRSIADIVKMPGTLKYKRRMARAIPKKCVKCGGIGGTHFWRESDVLRAVCEASPKCDLNMAVNAGFYSNIHYLMDITQDDMQEKRANIIRLKMDTLFNYVTETESAKRFKKDLETYQGDEAMFNTYKDYAENMTSDPVRMRLIKKKSHEIYGVLRDVRRMMEEYDKTGDKQVLHDAVEKQVNELRAEIDALRTLKYPVMEMVADLDGVQHLRQSEYNPDLLDYPLLKP